MGKQVSKELFALRIPKEAEVVDRFSMPSFPGEEESNKLETAPDATLTLLSGQEIPLKSLRGEVVILDFWAVWCKPCHELMPVMMKLKKTYRGKPVRILAVDVGDSESKVKAFLKKKGWEIDVAMDSKANLAQKFGANALPMTVVIAPDGSIHSTHFGYSGQEEKLLSEEIEELLKQAG